MAAKELDVSGERIFDAPRDVVWALAADTNRWDRASGLAAATYSWREIDGRRVRIGTAKELGVTIEWVEPPYQWIEACFLLGERRLRSGPVERAGIEVRLEDAPGQKTRVTARAFIASNGLLANVASGALKGRFKRSIADYLESMEGVLARLRPEDRESTSEPAVMRVRRALMGGFDPLTSGPRAEANTRELGLRERRLRDRGVPPRVVENLVKLIGERPDEEVAQIRPFELARVWQMPRSEVLAGFLHATRAGLVDLRWQINCPVCRVSAGVVTGLEHVGNKVHCDACNIDYGIDFGSYVEAVFQTNPAVRQVTPQVYCASSPSFLPHVFGQLTVQAGGTREEPCLLPLGTMRVRTLHGRTSALVEVPDDKTLVDVVVTADHIAASVAPREGCGMLRVRSEAATEDVVLFERAGWSAEAVLGSVIASFPEFLDLFATEAPAAGVDLAIGHLVVLFSDLTGSTALYERVGDARAFAIVQEHFDSMESVVRAEGGAVVKTMGDAVMATFPTGLAAVRAAIRMIESNQGEHGSLGLGVKIGVRGGACLAVRANDRLDFFGTTVNLAARFQNEAKAGELVVDTDLAAHPDVAPLIEPYPRRELNARLKGIAAAVPLLGIRVREM